MNKKIITIVMAAIMASTAVFASGASEATLIYNAADNTADKASVLVAGTHELIWQSLDQNGNVTAQSSEKVTLSKKTIDGWYFNQFATGNDIMSLVSEVYDGFAFTPFEDGISSDFISYSITGQEVVNGQNCNVISIEYAMDPALLKYKAHFEKSEEFIGYDFDDDDFDDTVTAVAYVNAETSALVRLILNWNLDSKTIVQTNEYSLVNGQAAPSQITFDVTQTDNLGGVIQTAVYRIVDTLSNYSVVDQFTRTRD